MTENVSRAAPSKGTRRALWLTVFVDLLLLTIATVTIDAVVVWRIYEDALLDQRVGVAAVLTQTIQTAMESIPPEAIRTQEAQQIWLKRILEPYAERNLGIDSAALYDTSGHLRFSAGPVPVVDEMDEDLKGALEDQQEIMTMTDGMGLTSLASVLQITVPVRLRTGDQWVVRVRMPLIESQGVLSRMQLAILGILFANAILVGAVGYLLLRRRLLLPIASLAAAVNDVTEGKLGLRLDIKRPDEFGDLARRFNQMLETLEQSQQRIQSQLQSLEASNIKLVAAQEELVASEKLASVGRLAAGIAHEVGNPLASIMGFVEVLIGDSEGMAKDTLLRVQREVSRIDVIMREMLELAKPPRGVVERHNARLLVEELMDFLKHQPGIGDSTHIDIKNTALPDVLIMPERVRQCLLNLVLNASHAMNGSGKLTVSIFELLHPRRALKERFPDWASFSPSALPEQGRFVALAVEDTGPGIPLTHLGEIFDPFFTTKEPGEGTGLGLSVTLGLMEAQGGYVQVDSLQGKGTCVTLLLPIAPAIVGGEPT